MVSFLNSLFTVRSVYVFIRHCILTIMPDSFFLADDRGVSFMWADSKRVKQFDHSWNSQVQCVSVRVTGIYEAYSESKYR
jgi:hypothetical protein